MRRKMTKNKQNVRRGNHSSMHGRMSAAMLFAVPGLKWTLALCMIKAGFTAGKPLHGN